MTCSAALGKGVSPPGVVGHIPTDSARRLRRRVRCEVEAIRSGCGAQVEIDDSGAPPGSAIVAIDLQRFQCGCNHHDPTPNWTGTSGQTRPRAPRHYRDLVTGGNLYHFGDLVCRLRECHASGFPSHQRRVFAEYVKFDWLFENVLLAKCVLKIGEQRHVMRLPRPSHHPQGS